MDRRSMDCGLVWNRMLMNRVNSSALCCARSLLVRGSDVLVSR